MNIVRFKAEPKETIKNATEVVISGVSGFWIYDAQVTVTFDVLNGSLVHEETLSMQMIAVMYLNLLTEKQLTQTPLGRAIAACYEESKSGFDGLKALTGAVFTDNAVKRSVSGSERV